MVRNNTYRLANQIKPHILTCREIFLGIHIINLGKTWEKLVFASRIIAAIENVSAVMLRRMDCLLNKSLPMI
jgi:small subunit ribosomal protein SAe